MIVLDASVVVELLTNGALAESIRSDLAQRDESFIVPHLIDGFPDTGGYKRWR